MFNCRLPCESEEGQMLKEEYHGNTQKEESIEGNCEEGWQEERP